MTWTGIARREHSRKGLRYPSDVTDREWLLTAPVIPPAKSGGRKRTTDMREVLNAILYIASSGCAWRMLPKCFPPVSTVRRYFYAWRNAGLFESINTVLVMNLREIEGRDGAVDVLKSVRFRFPWLRHIFADGGYAGDKLRQAIKDHGDWTIEIIKRSDAAKGFVLLPRRWVVERTFVWLGRCRRRAKDWETSIASSTAWAHIASIRMITRRTARYCYA